MAHMIPVPPVVATPPPVPPPTLSSPFHSAPERIDRRLASSYAIRCHGRRTAFGRSRRAAPIPSNNCRHRTPRRLPELVPVRYGRMLVSPFTFFRGAAGIMAADLATMPSTGLRVQACGDCHLLNFGGFATPERNIIFDINDFDETLPAPWEWDVKRLAASFVLAARSNGLSDNDGWTPPWPRRAATVNGWPDMPGCRRLKSWYASIDYKDFLSLVTDPALRKQVKRNIANASQRSSGSELDYPKLAGMVSGQLHIRDAAPLIFHPEVAREPDFMARLEAILATYRDTLPDERRALFDRYRLVDAAIKVVGIGSVGRRCWIGLFMSAGNDPLFLQFKEARASVFEPYAGRSVYPHHGQRVVIGQRLMQPASDVFLGLAQR